MSAIIMLSTMKAVDDCTALPVGAIVSYGDQANSRSSSAVVDAELGPYGQRVIRLDGTMEGSVSQNILDGPGGWHREEGQLSATEVEALKNRRLNISKSQCEQREHRYKVRSERMDAGKAWLEEHAPADAKAVIVATLQEDESDSMTDYFSSKTVKTVLLAWSKNKRCLFAEMRKGAARFEPTAHLADAPAEAEHREKYSMGRGYYLALSRYSGWQVNKQAIGNLHYEAGDPASRELL